ncbi:hypothetical protein KGA66_04350 [Actinocrinis puniceicyclus]|uniref:Uncharacterized protein n=1 Tax=Actinocrinis puniceicyclus TaxID=977794 RepID=A0A8J7WM25_9ACTN|nr:hypothetical protein [Actinocrinis puniceicyclus]MBS2962264.1 hypothetical protein [Actinocrinis puniceicyclus]
MNFTELREQSVELVPAREALSVTMAWVDAYNKALAVNLYSDYSDATALAGQSITIS